MSSGSNAYGSLLSSMYAPLDDPDGTKAQLERLQQSTNRPPQGAWQMPGTTPDTRAQGATIAANHNVGAPTPAQAPPTPGASTVAPAAKSQWTDMLKQALEGQRQNAQAASQTVQKLATQPSEQEALDSLQQQRTSAAAPLNPNDPQYRPTTKDKWVRGLKAAVQGLAQGGIVGAAAGPVLTDYKAPNRQYGIDTAKQAANVASLDEQLKEGQKAYEDETNRSKGIAGEERSTATSFGDVAKGATDQENRENQEQRDEETERHNQEAEAERQRQEQDTHTYQQGELTNKQRENQIATGRLGVEQGRLALDQKDGGPKGQAALDRESKQFGGSWEKDNDAANEQLEKISDARSMINGNAEAQSLGIPKVLTSLVGGKGSGVRITMPELQLIAKARGLTGDVEGTLNSWAGKGKLTKTQQQQLTQIMDDVKQRLVQKQSIANETMNSIYNAGSRDEIVKAHQTGRQKLSDFEQGKSGSAGGKTSSGGFDWNAHPKVNP